MSKIMNHYTFELWRRRASAAGQRELANTVRTLVFRADERLFERLDFADDAQFLHPTLFAHLTDPAPPVALDQTLYGLMRLESRPYRVDLVTDTEGRAFLGPFGTLETSLPSAALAFGRVSANDSYRCDRDGLPVRFRFRPPVLEPQARIQITTDIDPLLRRFFVTASGEPIDVETVRVPRERISDALLALGLLRTCCPAIWRDIASYVRLVVLYTAVEPNSFAALSAHGAVFCNLQPQDNELAVLEDLAHQGAHIMFNALAHNPAKLLRTHADAPITTIADAPGDERTVHVILHALFTYTLICRVLLAVRAAGAVSDVRSHELLGRFALTMWKFGYDLQLLNLSYLYTAAGRRCYEAFAEEFAELQRLYGHEIAALDLGGQAYVFDYRHFLARNQGPWPAMCELTS